MSNEVYANDNAISCKSGDGKVIAAMPDVCLSPPSPPAGPVPIPYPNTSFSKDLQQGSKTVVIDGKEIALKDQSFFKTSPLGDEPATNSFGGSVITHVITGKTYFNAWSMDVKFEGANVDRHMDLTTSNHASYPGSTGPMSEMEKLALKRFKEGKCPCCGKKIHGRKQGKAKQRGDVDMNRDEWYLQNIQRRYPNPTAAYNRLNEYITTIDEIKDMEAKKKAGDPTCPCKCKGKTRLLPEAPCDLFIDNPNPVMRRRRRNLTKRAWNRYRATYQKRKGIKSIRKTREALIRKGKAGTTEEIKAERQVNHLNPKGAGCPTGNNNLQASKSLCDWCRERDGRFTDWQ
jgi:hypothetical protein